MTSVSTFKQLKKYVSDQDGVATLDMAFLRELQGAERLGNGVIAEIKKELDRVDIGFVAPDGSKDQLPRYSEQPVRLYVRSSAVGKFIEAVSDLGDGGDERLRDLAGEAAVKLEQIRAIVGD